jgi:hypothetical protein
VPLEHPADVVRLERRARRAQIGDRFFEERRVTRTRELGA